MRFVRRRWFKSLWASPEYTSRTVYIDITDSLEDTYLSPISFNSLRVEHDLLGWFDSWLLLLWFPDQIPGGDCWFWARVPASDFLGVLVARLCFIIWWDEHLTDSVESVCQITPSCDPLWVRIPTTFAADWNVGLLMDIIKQCTEVLCLPMLLCGLSTFQFCGMILCG